MSKLSKDILDDYLCDAFTELRPHVEVVHPECIKEMEQAYTQLKEIVEEHFGDDTDAWFEVMAMEYERGLSDGYKIKEEESLSDNAKE